MATANEPRTCTPPKGRLLWSLDEATLVAWSPDRVRFSRQDDSGVLEFARAEWMSEVVGRLALGPVDLANIPSLAEDNAAWLAQRARRPGARWPQVRRLIDALGWHITPWYQPPAASAPLLALPGVRPDPTPFTLPEIDPASTHLRLRESVEFEAVGDATVVSESSLSRCLWVYSQSLSRDLKDWRQSPCESPQFEPHAPHVDIVRCLAAAGLLTAESSGE